MPSSTICAHIPQSPNIVLHLPPQIVLNLHVRQLGRQIHDCCIFQTADFRPRVDVEFRHDALRDRGPDAEEGFEGPLDERRFREAEAVDEHLKPSVSCMREELGGLVAYHGGSAFRRRVRVLECQLSCLISNLQTSVSH